MSNMKEINCLIIGDMAVKPKLIESHFRKGLKKRPDIKVNFTSMNTYYPRIVKIYREKGLTEAFGEEAPIIDAIRDSEILITNVAPITVDVISAAKKLRIIGVTRGGPANIDVKAATKKGIIVVNAPGRNSDNVADFTIGLIIALSRNIVKGHLSLSRGVWDWKLSEFADTCYELPRKTLGIVGFGQIGKRVTLRARNGFNMNVLVYDPYVDENEVEMLGGRVVDLQHLLQSSDVVTIHARLTPETVGLIGKKEIGLMKRKAYLINTARNEIVEQSALYEALKKKRIAGAAIDVFEKEPVEPQNPLLSLENVVVTPHIAWISREMPERAVRTVTKDLFRFMDGKRPFNVLNPEVLTS